MLNVSKVVKELKRSSHIFWAKKDNEDYICNGYWAIKTDLKEIKNRKILGFLIETFGEFPPENKIMNFIKHFKTKPEITNITKDSWLNIFEIEDKQVVVDTRLTIGLPHRGDSARIFKGEGYIYLNIKYLEMVNLDKTNIYGNKELKPVAFTNNNESVVILPIKIGTDNGTEYLKNIND